MMLKPGLRVVRGPNWSWENQDGGEGYVGTVRDINLPGTPNQTVVVHWDNGSQLNCRVGHEKKYDLRVIDNAQIGAKHRHVCDECDKSVAGMRFHCTVCYDYDLCYMCYHSDKHDLTHYFKRFDDADSAGVNLPPRLNARKCQLKGVFKGATVVRGFDWQWGNQDGGQGNIGTVLDIKGWRNNSDRSTANIKWHFGNTDLYRIGHKGYCDIQCVEPSPSGEYYPEHLPVLGQREEEMEWNGILNAIDAQQIMELEKQPNKQEQEHLTLAPADNVESLFSNAVINYNKRVCASLLYDENGTNNKPLQILHKVFNISEHFRDKEVEDMWDMLKFMTNLPSIVFSDNVIVARYSEDFVKKLILQGKKYLEDRYKEHMESKLKENNSEPSQTETPGLYRLVHDFVGLRFQGEYLGLQDGTVDNRPLWPMVYYCLRSGDISAAIYCLRDCMNPEVKEIITVLEKKRDDAFSAEIDVLQENIRMLYQSAIRNCTDPFKRMIWAILGGCDEISEASRTADDYLWFKLNLARVDCNDGGYIKYEDLQYTLLEEQGESHFDASNRPYLYFKLLLLTGQFEAAVDFLFRTEKFKIHAVHMAIVLNELNLLAVPQDMSSPLLSLDPSDPKPARRLNFVLVIKNYVERFEARDLNALLNYLFLLRNFKNAEGKNVFEASVAELVVRTKEYVKILGKFEQSNLLGQPNTDFCRTNGLLDQFSWPNLFLNVVKGIKTQIMGKIENWEVLLDFYDTVNDEESSLHFMCSMLAQVAHLESRPDSLRNKLQEKASRMAEHYSSAGYNGHQSIYSSFVKARGLLVFFDQYREQQYSEALRTLAALQIVPIKAEELTRAIRNFQSLNKHLKEAVPHVLLAKMAILAKQYEKIIKATEPNQQHLGWVWEQANTLTNFAEQLPREVIQDAFRRLVTMELSLHS